MSLVGYYVFRKHRQLQCLDYPEDVQMDFNQGIQIISLLLISTFISERIGLGVNKYKHNDML